MEDLPAALEVGQGDLDGAVETAWSGEGGVEQLFAVGGGHNDDFTVRSKTIHLDQQLVQSTISLVI